MLSMRYATVIVADKTTRPVPTSMWTIDRKGEVAKRLRRRMLNPDGNKVYLRHLERDRDVNRRERDELKIRDAQRRRERAIRTARNAELKAAREATRIAGLAENAD